MNIKQSSKQKKSERLTKLSSREIRSQIESSTRIKRDEATKKIKEIKEVKNSKIKKMWFGSIKSYIESKVRLFIYGL